MITLNNLESLSNECSILYEYSQDIQHLLGNLINAQSLSGNSYDNSVSELMVIVRNCESRAQRILSTINEIKEK